jgi:hypothetical protein
VLCAHCGSYIIFEERTQGEYEPHLILPFKLGKKDAQELIRKEFGKKPFLPDDFLSDAKMSEMEGMYVPYFMYDFSCDYHMTGTGRKVRTWRSGNKEFTETSIYNVKRHMKVFFEKIPVDASIAMPDDAMDMVEPYAYGELEPFQAKYMSGFEAEKYNMSQSELEPRAKKKARENATRLMNETLSDYTSIGDREENVQMDTNDTKYSLLPVWNYSYTYKGKSYPFKLNGQSGKISGEPPISKAKVVGYSATIFLSILAMGGLFNLIMGVL